MKLSKQLVLLTLVGCLFVGSQSAHAGWKLKLPELKLPPIKLPTLKKPESKSKKINHYLVEMKRRDKSTVDSAVAFAKFLNSKDANAVKIRKALKTKDYNTADRLLKANPQFVTLSSKTKKQGFKTLTIGIGGDASVIVGGSFEFGVAIDLTGKNKIKGYRTTSLSIGISAGVDGCVSVGWWRAENDKINGKSYGVIGAASYGLSVNYGAWFDDKSDRNKFYKFPKSSGHSVAVGGGVGAELGEFNTSTTKQK